MSGLARSVVGEVLLLHPMPDVREVLRQLTASFVEAVEDSPVDLSGVVVATWGEVASSPEVRAIVRAEFQQARTLFVDVLEGAKAAGHLAPEVDTVAAAEALFGMMPGFMLQRLVLQDVDPESYSSGLRALMGQGEHLQPHRCYGLTEPSLPKE